MPTPKVAPSLSPAERAMARADVTLLRRRIAQLNRFINSDRLGPAAHELARTQRDEAATELKVLEASLHLDALVPPAVPRFIESMGLAFR